MALLSILAEPWFVIPWYAFGLVAALWVIRDERVANTPLKTAMKWAWPIVVFFFSPIGLALYLLTARAPDVEERAGEEKKRAHARYEESMLRRVNGAVIHCVAGDGLGIMTGMVIARVAGMSFWQEFWFEYAVGFAFGWLVFQLKSMMMMTDSVPQALAMAFRAEFFSMLTVMAGMGAVMTYVTPMVVGAQPKPLTFAFWGFGMLGLLAGYVLTFPMNWMMVKVGWKHGMGPKEGAHPVEQRSAKIGLVAAMTVLGIAALLLPAWLTEVREGAACPAPSTDLAEGAKRSIASARDALDGGARTRATRALDDVRRIVTVGANAAPEVGFDAAKEEVARARAALQRGDEAGATQHLARAEGAIRAPAPSRAPDEDVRRYVGATAVDDGGRIVGEVVAASGEAITIEVAPWRDVWGFVDLARGSRVDVPIDAVDLGPRRAVGMKLVAVRGPIACTLSARSGAPRPRSARSGG